MVKIVPKTQVCSEALRAAKRLQKSQKNERVVETNAKDTGFADTDAFDTNQSNFRLPSVAPAKQTPGNALMFRAQTMAGAMPQVRKNAAGTKARGDLKVKNQSELELLRGVVHLEGTLTIAECHLTSLDALSTIKRVSALAIEGLSKLESLDLAGLNQVDGNFYVGFNEGLRAINLPALQSVGGALVVEGNNRAETIEMSEVKSVGKYVHVVENESLRSLAIGTLGDTEIVVEGNPTLRRENTQIQEGVEWAGNA